MRRFLRDLVDRVRPLPPFLDPIVCVRETSEHAEAELIAGLLREHGVAATVRVSESSTWAPGPQTGWGAVLVPREQEEQARRVLDR